jgi:siroheme synthase-like protein
MPVGISLKKSRCLVVGGGTVALRKVDNLLNYASEVTVVAPEIHEKLDYYARRGLIKVEKREYKSPEAAQYGIVIAACDNKELNGKIYEDCRKSATLVNTVDNPALCDFIFPAVVQRDCLTIAVSSDGKAPFLAGNLKLILENIFPDHWQKIASLAARFRKMVMDRWDDEIEKKNACYERFIAADWKTIIKEKNDHEIDNFISGMLEF